VAIVDEIRRLLSVQPFEPFTIVTSAGNRYEVVSPDHAHTNPQRTRAIVYFDDGTYVIASGLHIASVESREPTV
jgi:hypothetical protein